MLSDAWEAVGGYGEECSTFIAKFPPTLDIAMSDQWGFLDGSSERLSHTLRLVHVTLSKSEGPLDDLKVSEFRADGISATRPFEAHFKALGAHERAEGDIGQSPRAAINLPDSAAVRGLADNDQKIRI